MLAVAEGKVREAYEPVAWSPSPVPGEEHRIGSGGHVAGDSDRWVGMDVSTVFPQGSQNPVRYVAAADLGLAATRQPAAPSGQPSVVVSGVRASDPGLAELVNPLLEALEADLMWSMSGAAQKLFYSNTLASLMSQHAVDSTFVLPPPWRHLSYEVLRALEELAPRTSDLTPPGRALLRTGAPPCRAQERGRPPSGHRWPLLRAGSTR